MKSPVSYIVPLLLVLRCLTAGAQALPQAPEISSGVLSNGISYYLAVNPRDAGLADFAVVQKGTADRPSSRRLLVSLPHFGGRRPCDFLSGRGVPYGRNGYVSYGSGTTTYHFRGVPVSDRNVCDSMLLMVLDIASAHHGEQALIVSGDVDRNAIADRLKLLSLMVPDRDGSIGEEEYEWLPSGEPTYYFSENPASGTAALRVSWSCPRVPRESMNTLQSMVSRHYAVSLGNILENRIRDDFRRRGIPIADIRFRYVDSAMAPGDEQFTMTVITSEERYTEAISRVSSVFARMDRYGASLAELKDARDRLASGVSAFHAYGSGTNEDYVFRCRAAFLYNASLASESTVADFLTGGRIPGVQELELFNSYASALLDPLENITIGFDTPYAAVNTDLTELFTSSWTAPEEAAEAGLTAKSDTSGVYRPSSKARIRSEAAEPVSGGRLWTFSNGMRVIYKRIPGSGRFSYAFMIRGGSASAPELLEGESAFVGDMLSQSCIAGMHGSDFFEMLRAHGITMEAGSDLSSIRIAGEAPSSGLHLLLGSLLSLANDRYPEEQAFAYYSDCETARLELRRHTDDGVRDYIDSLMFKERRYTGHKSAQALDKGLQAKAEALFADRFTHCSDGVLVLMGDLDEAEARRQCCAALGDFVTGKGNIALPRFVTGAIPGTVTLSASSSELGIGDGGRSVSVAVSAAIPFSMEGYMSLGVGLEALKDELAGRLAPLGAYAELESALSFYPEERVTLYVTCRPCLADGLPDDVEPAPSMSILDAVRASFAAMASAPLSSGRMSKARSAQLSRMNASVSDEKMLIDKVLDRYSYGKDTVSGYKNLIQKATPASVQSVFSALMSGGRVELMLL